MPLELGRLKILKKFDIAVNQKIDEILLIRGANATP